MLHGCTQDADDLPQAANERAGGAGWIASGISGAAAEGQHIEVLELVQQAIAARQRRAALIAGISVKS